MTGSPNVYVNDRRVIREGDHPLEDGGGGGGGLLDLLSQLQSFIDQVTALQAGSDSTQEQILSLNTAISNLTTIINGPESNAAVLERVNDLQTSIETFIQNIGQEAGLLNILSATTVAEYNANQSAIQSGAVLTQTQALFDAVSLLVEGVMDPAFLLDIQAAAAAAEAAQVAAEAAATSALNWSNTAQTHSTDAATHAGNAASSASSASTYATQSQTYATSAIAASTAATSAATTAQSHRDSAATYANNAANSATAAATSASSALTYLTDTISYSAAAEASSVTANLSRDDAVKAAGNTDFRYGTTNWTITPGGSFTHESHVSASGGKVIESNPGSAVTILSDATYPVPNAASVFTITAKIRQSINGSLGASGLVFVGFACYDVDGVHLGDRWAATGNTGHALVNADGWHVYTANISGFGAGQNNYFSTTTQVKLKAILNQSAVPLVEQQIDYMYAQDATLATQAADSASAAATSASNASASQTAAGNFATASQNSATQAATSAAAVGTAASAAAANAAQAGVYASEAATSASDAATSASQAATSATTAANSATAAGTSANSAATSATNAQTYATQSQSYSTAANTSATNAATSSSNAATQATNAANSATAASGSAASAGTSASNASTSATNAAGSAATATTQAGLASTSATNAGNSATAAASSATTASTAATNAGTFATNASNSALSAATAYNNIVAYDGNPFFVEGLTGWSSSVGGSASPLFTPQTVTDAIGGKVLRTTISIRGDMYSLKGIPVDISKKYRLRAKIKTSSGATIAATWYVGFAGLDATGAVVPHAPYGSYRYVGAGPVNKTENDGWFVIDALISGIGNDAVNKFPPGTVQVKLLALANYNNAAVTCDIDYLYIVDADLAEQASASAAAASVSATQSATSASNASTSASQASTSQTLAAGSATAAGTSATNAANSATAASGSAGTAATHASNASVSATAAATSATNAAGSATTATTQAGIATTAATNAGTSETNAASSAASAGTHASNAATSATNAAGSASSASTSAGLAVSSATASAASATEATNLANTLLYKEGEYSFESGAKAWGVGYTTNTSPLTEPLLMPGINNTTVTSITGSQFSKNKGLGITAEARVFHKHYYAIDTTKRYAFKYRFRKTANSTVGTSNTAIGLIHYDTTKSYISADLNILSSTLYTVASGWVVGEIVLVGENASPSTANKNFKTGTKYVRMYLDANITGGNAVYEWDTLSFEYVELVEQSRDQAGIATTQAAAASVSATNAATSATNASGSASTASTQAGIATSAATTSTTQAGNASTSAANAAGSASSAAATAILLFPADFTINKDAWTNTATGAANSGPTTSKPIVSNASLGPCLEFAGIGQNIWSKGLLPATAGKIYEIEVIGIYTADVTDGTGAIYIGVAGLDAAYATPIYVGSTSTTGMNVAGGKFTITRRFSDVANGTYSIQAWTAGKVWLRPYVLFNNAEAGSPIVHAQSIRIRDVTEYINSQIQAAAASVSATTATTQAANASVSATNAANSATSATASASTASTQAGIATSAATTATTQAGNAGTSATDAANSAVTATTQAANASTSATSAATSATNAATSASTASTQAGISTSAATTATTQAGNASTSATNAATSASTATTQAANALAAATQAYNTSAALFPADFTVGKESWTDSQTGAPTAVATTVNPIVTNGTLGQCLQLTGPNTTFMSKGVLPSTVGRVYELEVSGIYTADPTDGNGSLFIYFVGLDAAYALTTIVGPQFTTNMNVAGGKFTCKQRFSDTANATYGILAWAAGSVWHRARVKLNNAESGTPIVHIQYFKIKDVTEVVNAEKQVTAAAAQATAAGVSATNAAGSATTATAQAANASTSASNAATSATNASTSAGTASTQAGIATSAATTSTTQAGIATTQAGNASTSATNAATSATNAAGSATTASTQAGIATSAATTSTTQAGIATTQAGNALTAATNAYNAANSLFPADFTVNKEAWTNTATGPANSGPTTGKPIVTNGTLGPCLEFSGVGANLWAKGLLPATAGRVYELELCGIFTADTADGTGATGIYMTCLDASFVTPSYVGLVVTAGMNVAGGKFTVKQRFSNVADATYGIIAWTGGTVWLRPYVLFNNGETGSPIVHVQYCKVKDVTEVVNAEKQVTAATTQAGTATTQAGIASTQAANASTSATNAATSATTANTAAASASSSATVAARVSSGTTMNANPLFANWAGTYPDNWSLWSGSGGTTVKNTVNARYGPNCVEMDSTSANAHGIAINGAANMIPLKATHYVIEAEAELVTGASMNGAGVNVVWTGSPADAQIAYSFATHGTISGNTYYIKKVVAADAGVLAIAAPTDIYLYAMNNYAAMGTLTIKKVRWHKLSIRTATTEEIRTFNVATEIAAAVTVESNARATSDGIIEAKYGVKVDVNGYVSGFGLIATANNAAPTSTFTVLADNFLVVKPGGGGDSATPKQMFAVGTVGGVTTLTLNGNLVADGTITSRGLNVTAKNLVVDPVNAPNKEGWKKWSTDGNMTVITDPTGRFQKVFSVVSNANAIIYSDTFPIDITKAYKVKCSLYDNRPAVGGVGYSYVGVHAINDPYEVNTQVGSDIFIPGSGTVHLANQSNVYTWYGQTNLAWRDIEFYLIPFGDDGTKVPRGKNNDYNVRFMSDNRGFVLRFLNYYNAGTTNTLYVGGISVTEVDAGTIYAERIAAGTIKSSNIDTTSFNAAGVAIFGGDLKSSGYTPGVTGWRISNDGTAEFKDLIIRSWVADNAVADRMQTTVMGGITAGANNSVKATLNIGATLGGEIRKRGVSFQAVGAPYTSLSVVIEARKKSMGGAWSAWYEVDTIVIASASYVWQTYGSSGTLTGVFDDFEYRVKLTHNHASSTVVLGDLYITVINLVK